MRDPIPGQIINIYFPLGRFAGHGPRAECKIGGNGLYITRISSPEGSITRRIRVE